jgi:tetratricopeptide (TPR) repeat protein
MSRNRWISPALQGLLDELASSPSSVLFGRGAALAPGAQTKLASAHRAPERWNGRETGLLAIERELLRAHREEVGHLVRQVSFALTRRLPGLVERLDPQLDRAAQARALPRETLQQTQRELARLDPDQPRSVARLAQAVQLDLQDPRDAIALLRQAQRIAPHASTLQHTAFWNGQLGNLQDCLGAAIQAISFCSAGPEFVAAQISAGFASFELGAFSRAAEHYSRAHSVDGSVHLLATSWLCSLLSSSPSAEFLARDLLQELARNSEVVAWLRSYSASECLGLIGRSATDPESLKVHRMLQEAVT